ncbi:hypothetical protein PVK06_004864 [Gossypium arboreum]|uniref:RNase H type-1 domain-containing protein n=1 Tax=Gossypium arboreum TaxID=29729 RepID=A0ABR0QUC2_GOSAR|nr:hypothetical protein PVK06_004864 [Gossypium arboreum]
MNAKISSIRQDFRRDYPPCGANAKTLVHALKDHPTAWAILTLGGLDGFGVITRDSNGFILGRGGGFKNEEMMTEWAEFYAFEEGFKLAHSLNIANAIFETDCGSVVNKFKKCKDDITIIGHHTKETYKTLEMFTTIVVKWANCSCSKVADFMCKYAILNNFNMVSGMDYPREIHDIVIRDSFN